MGIDERQALSQLANMVGLENIALDIARANEREMKEIMRKIINNLGSLPEGSIERELVYKRIREIIESDLLNVSLSFTNRVTQVMASQYLTQAEWAAKWIDVGPRTLPSTGLTGQALDRVQVLGKAMDELVTPTVRAQMKDLDTIVRKGILEGQTSVQIARAFYDGPSKKIKRQYRALARTAVMEMAQQAHFEVWDELAGDRIVEWRFDATFDFKVCPRCAALDGETRTSRSDFSYSYDPSRGQYATRVHPNCRCFILPVTTLGKARDEEAPPTEQRSVNQIYDEQPTTGRVYKTKAKGHDGKKYYRAAKEIELTRGRREIFGFLDKASPATIKNILGKARGEYFMLSQNKGLSDEQLFRRFQYAESAPIERLKARLSKLAR